MEIVIEKVYDPIIKLRVEVIDDGFVIGYEFLDSSGWSHSFLEYKRLEGCFNDRRIDGYNESEIVRRLFVTIDSNNTELYVGDKVRYQYIGGVYSLGGVIEFDKELLSFVIVSATGSKSLFPRKKELSFIKLVPK